MLHANSVDDGIFAFFDANELIKNVNMSKVTCSFRPNRHSKWCLVFRLFVWLLCHTNSIHSLTIMVNSIINFLRSFLHESQLSRRTHTDSKWNASVNDGKFKTKEMDNRSHRSDSTKHAECEEEKRTVGKYLKRITIKMNLPWTLQRFSVCFANH